MIQTILLKLWNEAYYSGMHQEKNKHDKYIKQGKESIAKNLPEGSQCTCFLDESHRHCICGAFEANQMLAEVKRKFGIEEKYICTHCKTEYEGHPTICSYCEKNGGLSDV